MTKSHVCLAIGWLLILRASPMAVSAQSTAFTYQGSLSVGGAPANGAYDLTFSLFQTNSGGTEIGATLTNMATPVTNGLFTVILDFGVSVAAPDLWLEIAVETNGGPGFATLNPRQELTSVPYAVTAITASNLTGTLPVDQLAGSISYAQLPAASLTNDEMSEVVFRGSVTVTNYPLATVNSIYTNTLSATGQTNVVGTNVIYSADSNGNISGRGNLTIYAGTSVATGLSTRTNFGGSYPVPTLRPDVSKSVMALDLMPNGKPSQASTYGICWFDVCDTDCLTNGFGTATARVSIRTNGVFFGSENYAAALLPPVWIGLNDIPYLTLHTNGNWDATNSPANAGYFRMNNTNIATNAYAEISAYSALAQTAIIAYSPLYSADSSNFSNGSSLSASQSNLFLIAASVGAHIKILTGGQTASTNTRVDVDGTGNITMYGNAFISGTVQATNGVTSLAMNLTAPAIVPVGPSPFNWTNSTQQNVYVFVNGTNVTGVAINGYGIFGSGNATVPLQPNEYVSVSYSSAPTVTVKPF